MTIGRKKKRRSMSVDLERLLGRAQKLYLAERFSEAIELLLEVVRKKPKMHVPYVTLSMIHEEMGDTERSLSYLLIAAQVAENDSDLWVNVAHRSREQGNIRQVSIHHMRSLPTHSCRE